MVATTEKDGKVARNGGLGGGLIRAMLELHHLDRIFLSVIVVIVIVKKLFQIGFSI